MTAKRSASKPRSRATKGWPPRYLTPTTAAERKRGDGDLYCDFIEACCRVTKSSFAAPAGSLIELRSWQRELLRGLLARRADGRRKHRQALIGIGRKNTKSTIGAGLGLGALVLSSDGCEVYSCAADREQGRIVHNTAKRMVELDEELSGLIKVYKDALEIPATSSVYRVLSAEAFTKEGLNPNTVVFDEVHAQPNRELWDVMNLGSGARIDPIVLGITTAGARTDNHGQDTICYELYQHGLRVANGDLDDPTFFFAWWEPARGTAADHRKPATWKEANPGYGDLIDPEDFAAVLPRTPESEFRTKRCNQWVISRESALPHGSWDSCADEERVVSKREPVVLFVDGSYSGDSTGIIGCTRERTHVFTVECWERDRGEKEWRVPIEDVKATLRDWCSSHVVEMVCFDPYRWQQTMQDLEAEGLPIVEFPTGSLPRMVPAWKKFYDAVLNRTLTHDGDLRLARHIENMRLKIDAQGVRPVKEHRSSGRHIDLGICAVGAHDVASSADVEEQLTPMVAFT